MTDAPASYDSTDETRAHIKLVRACLKQVIEQLDARAAHHDASKLRDPEKADWDRATPYLADHPYGTQEYRDSFAKLGLTETVRHHYLHNDHHPEWFARDDRSFGTEIDTTMLAGGVAVGRMNLIQLLEMLADWKAAGQRPGGTNDIHASIDYNTNRFGLSPQLGSILHRTAESLGW